ncbi:uncharacterized protein LOC34622078 [Cyclospora cayetanensis]|uniref:Uncharacterized protein LOC34622078 n=1 Tax=Cyclospora cayetanensis TaxID=88456 RepID=A0A6P6RTG4_9EIME|nr:uncharacterized protein LOC34622078 [Cyclospora cayetanensis]
MTLLQAVCCATVSLGPIVAIYHATSLSVQTETRRLMGLSTLFYCLYLFAKSLLVASILPATCEEFFMCSVVEDVVAVLMELFALHYILVSKKALSYAAETRLICVGLGWALGHVFFTNGHYILKGLRDSTDECASSLLLHGLLQGAVAAFSLIIYLSVASLIFLSTRRHRPLHSRVTYLAFAALLVPWTLTLSVCCGVRQGLGLSSRASQFLFEEISGFCWLALLIRLCIAVCAGVSTYLIIRDRPGTPGKGSKGGAFFRKVE